MILQAITPRTIAEITSGSTSRRTSCAATRLIASEKPTPSSAAASRGWLSQLEQPDSSERNLAEMKLPRTATSSTLKREPLKRTLPYFALGTQFLHRMESGETTMHSLQIGFRQSKQRMFVPEQRCFFNNFAASLDSFSILAA